MTDEPLPSAARGNVRPVGDAGRSDRVVVIGVGNAHRADDAVGLVAAARLEGVLPADVPVHALRGEISALMDAWSGAAAAVLIDAVQSGAAPGTVQRLDVSAAPLPTGLATASTHGLSLPQAIELARTLEVLPPRVIVFGVEGQRFVHGRGLSAAVEAAVGTLVTAVHAEVERLRGDARHTAGEA